MALMYGPWSSDDYKSFIELGVRIGPTGPVNRLAQLYALGWPNRPEAHLPPETSPADFETLEAAWEVRRKHPIYEWLQANQNFRAAWTTFQKRRRRTHDGKLAEINAELVFLRLVVYCAGMCFLYKALGDHKFDAPAPKRRSATAHVKALLSLMKEGVSLPDYSQQDQLEALLRKLQTELSTNDRKRYEGERVAGKRPLEDFAYDLITHLDLRSPAIVEDVANMVGLSRERTTCERYVKNAARRRRSQLAKALRDP